jgi:hypothetical protein
MEETGFSKRKAAGTVLPQNDGEIFGCGVVKSARWPVDMPYCSSLIIIA